MKSYINLARINSNKSMLTDISEVKNKFFSACSCIYSNLHNETELLQLELQEFFILPIWTYCTAAVKLFVNNLKTSMHVGTHYTDVFSAFIAGSQLKVV